MRWNVLAGVVTALAFLVPTAPAAAQTASPGLNEACQTIERPEYKDLRKLIDVDLDTATNVQVRIRTNQVVSAARIESLVRLADAGQAALGGSEEDPRAFLKTGMEKFWSEDLLALVSQTLAGGGAHVKAAAQKVLDENTIDAALAYLNDGLYIARELDCQPSPSPVQTPPSATPSSGATLAKTGADTLVLAFGGILLVAFGIGAVVLARRTRA
jgi:LPXTG-motif cell wall-anchored protein